MPLPQTYKAAVLDGAGQPFTLRDKTVQQPGPGQILVKVLACGVCYSDVALSEGEMGDVFPRVPGHELVGSVSAVSSNVSTISVGDRVGAAWHGGHDGTCGACRRGQLQMCDNQVINGVSHDGGYSEYVLLWADCVVRVPSDMDPAEIAPLLCAGVTVFNGIRNMQVKQGALVAVQGLGGLGHLAVQYARAMGYEVAVISSGATKAELAKDLGGHHYINSKGSDVAKELQKLGGASLVVQTAPSPAVFSSLVYGLQAGGTLLSLAPIGPVPIDTIQLVKRAISVRGWPSGQPLDAEEAIRFASMHGVRCMVQKYPLDHVQQAIDDLKAGKSRFRNVLIMSATEACQGGGE